MKMLRYLCVFTLMVSSILATAINLALLISSSILVLLDFHYTTTLNRFHCEKAPAEIAFDELVLL